MALVYIDGLFVNEFMIKNGFASSTREAGVETVAVKAANDYARANKIGIYSPLCTQTEPPDPKCNIKGNYDYQQRQKIYFLPSCGYYSMVEIKKYQGDAWFCTQKEAQKAGFTKSASCQ